MVYTYTPTYYTSLHDSITSICKNILPFSFKKRRMPAIAAAEQRQSKQQSDNLKWQQESFHQILNLMGLCNEGIIQEEEVSTFRTHLLETILTAPIDHEPAAVLRDKLLFLQELFFAKCISEDEYHASKRPLLQRLAVQGATIGARDVIVGTQKEASNEEWSIIDLKEDQCPTKLESKKIKGVGESIKPRDRTGLSLVCSTENPFWKDCSNEKESESKSILMMEVASPLEVVEKQENGKKKLKALFQKNSKDGSEGRGNELDPVQEEKDKARSGKKASWGFDRFVKWKKNDSEDETAPLSLTEKSDKVNCSGGMILVAGEQNTEQMRKNVDSSADKALGRNMKEELTRIQTELRAKNPQGVHLRDRTEEISSTRLLVDNNDLNKFFPKSWCDQHGGAVLEVVRREYKDHMGQIGNFRATASVEKKHNSKRWTTFDEEEENAHPNVFLPPQNDHHSSYSTKKAERLSFSRNASRTSINSSSSSSIDKGFKYNPFFDM